MSLDLGMLAVMVPLLIGIVPRWAYSRHWGYGPSVGLTLVMLVFGGVLASGWLWTA